MSNNVTLKYKTNLGTFAVKKTETQNQDGRITVILSNGQKVTDHINNFIQVW